MIDQPVSKSISKKELSVADLHASDNARRNLSKTDLTIADSHAKPDSYLTVGKRPTAGLNRARFSASTLALKDKNNSAQIESQDLRIQSAGS